MSIINAMEYFRLASVDMVWKVSFKHIRTSSMKRMMSKQLN